MARGNILLADDNKLVVKITSAILEDADYEVSVAWDGMQAVNKAYAEAPDLIVLDVEMPKVNGYQVCRLLKDDEYTRDIPVIILTGRDHQSDMFWGLKTGADAYITKGFKPEQLIKVVDEQIEQSRKAEEEQERRPLPAKLLEEAGVLSRVIDLLDSKLFESTILNELGSLASVSKDYRETVKAVLGILSRVVGNLIGVVMMFEENDMIIQVNRPTDRSVLGEAKGLTLDFAEGYGWNHSRSGPVDVTVFGEENLKSAREEGEERACTCVHVPLTAQKKVIGVMALCQRHSPSFARDAQLILDLIQNQVTMVIDNARLYEATRQLAITDGLTKVYNHRFFQELFEKEFTRSDRYNTVFSLIMLDIDHFKNINDTYGHLCGDEILKGLAELIRGCLRSMDILARYGGEEFAMLLPETGGAEAFQTAERIRRTIESNTFMGNEHGLKVTVSMGVATYPSTNVNERADIIAKADAALYEAKGGGRNRVVMSE